MHAAFDRRILSMILSSWWEKIVLPHSKLLSGQCYYQRVRKNTFHVLYNLYSIYRHISHPVNIIKCRYQRMYITNVWIGMECHFPLNENVFLILGLNCWTISRTPNITTIWLCLQKLWHSIQLYIVEQSLWSKLPPVSSTLYKLVLF